LVLPRGEFSQETVPGTAFRGPNFRPIADSAANGDRRAAWIEHFVSVHYLTQHANVEACHLDRRRRSGATEEEWRDPENASITMPIQGVLRDGAPGTRGFRVLGCGETVPGTAFRSPNFQQGLPSEDLLFPSRQPSSNSARENVDPKLV
jgi:hypothetical protein